MTVQTLTLATAARMLREAIIDRSYQRETRLGGAVAQYLAWKRLSASARTLVIYEGYLARLCVELAYADPTIDQVTSEMLLEALTIYPTGSLRLVRTTYSDFFKWACRWGHRDRNPVDLLPAIPEPPMKVYDVFTATEQAQLVKAADQMPLPWIQRLRVLCFVDLGIRSEEARGLQPSDFDTVAKVVVVKGKGGKERVIPFGDETFRAFITYRNRPIPNVRMQDERGKYREARAPLDDDYLFFPLGFVKRTGAVTWADPFRPLSDRAMRSWWQDRIVASAGVRYRSLHMNRHTLGTDLSTAGEDLATVQDWLGHASP
ncbi:MAG: tyrosine-type recombinase/integrase, partial [Methanomicrobiales archaeon]|nr:tyrosine-type recombinase/integrase [Methanomicrobiales archaeon]